MLLRALRLFYGALGLLSALLPCAVRHVAVGYALAAVVICIIQQPSPEGREHCQPYKAYMPRDGQLGAKHRALLQGDVFCLEEAERRARAGVSAPHMRGTLLGPACARAAATFCVDFRLESFASLLPFHCVVGKAVRLRR